MYTYALITDAKTINLLTWIDIHIFMPLSLDLWFYTILHTS